MPVIDDELIARAIRWCADAGRHATSAQVRAALAPLSWDDLLAARALLADPPPARPLGPLALADMARGALPDVAAEREREGQYPPLDPGVPGAEPSVPERSPVPGRSKRARRAAGPVIHRARDRVQPSAAIAPRTPLVDELFASEGRAVLERLVRAHGARRAPITAALAAGWRRGDGTAIDEGDLDRLLDAHGLTRAFEARERDEMLHSVRAAGGVIGRAAAALSLSPDAFRAALERLRATRDAEAIRGVHRAEVRRQGTLSERTRLLLTDPEALADLGVLEEIEADLRERIPEHVRAVRASGADPLLPALARSLTVGPRDVEELAARLGLELSGLGADAKTKARPSLDARRSPAQPPRARSKPGRPGHGSGSHAGPRRPPRRRS